MSSKSEPSAYKEDPVSARVKIAILWACAMFLYIYADIKALFETGFIQQIIEGNLSGMKIDQIFLLIASVLMTIPPVMIVLTLFLRARVIRIVNIVIASLHILLAISLLLGPIVPWAYYFWYSGFEVAFLALIVFVSINWPKEGA